MTNQHPQHAPADLARLEGELSAVGPGWILSEGAEGLLRAERAGTVRYEQAAMSPRSLLRAVQTREAQLTNGTTTVQVHTGVNSG